jgi:hypothetical protein
VFALFTITKPKGGLSFIDVNCLLAGVNRQYNNRCLVRE